MDEDPENHPSLRGSAMEHAVISNLLASLDNKMKGQNNATQLKYSAPSSSMYGVPPNI